MRNPAARKAPPAPPTKSAVPDTPNAGGAGDVLVLGAARSGITVMAQALAAATGNSLTDLSGSLELLPEGGLACLSGGLGTGHQVLHAADFHADCPNLQAARHLLRARPDLRAVVLWRHGVDFINSRLRAFPHTDFISHCRIWATAMAEMHRICDDFASRVLVVRHDEIAHHPRMAAARIARFFALGPGAEQTLSNAFVTLHPGRTASVPGYAVSDAAYAGWTMAEIVLFDALCGAAAARVGHQVDLSAAERLRPIDLASALLARGQAGGGLALTNSASRGGAPIITGTGDAGAPGPRLYLAQLAAGQRTRLRLRLRVESCAPDSELRCALLESLSRRPVFVHTFALRAGTEATVDETILPHDGVLDMAFTQAAGLPAPQFSLTLPQATLSHA